MKKIKKNESGRSMVEVLGVLAIIGVLSVGGIAGYKVAMDEYKLNQVRNFLNLADLEYAKIWKENPPRFGVEDPYTAYLTMNVSEGGFSLEISEYIDGSEEEPLSWNNCYAPSGDFDLKLPYEVTDEICQFVMNDRTRGLYAGRCGWSGEGDLGCVYDYESEKFKATGGNEIYYDYDV